MKTSVLKFGGSSLADAGQIMKAADIIRSREGCRVVVVSAPGKRFPGDEKVTDLLYHCTDLLTRGRSAEEIFSQVENRYREIIRGLNLDISLEEEFALIRKSFAHPDRDYLASRGEYLSAKLLAAHLGVSFLDAAEGIFFRADGTLDQKRTYSTLSRLLQKHCRAVIPGFYGAMPDGTVHTFTRGGSDITGAIVARAAKASVYENWTDVSGVMAADPRIVEHPRVIEQISYQELGELSRGGADVFHEEAISPVREAKIPINIRNTNAPADPGTMIVAHTACRGGITGVSGKTGCAVLTVAQKNEKESLGSRVLGILDELGVAPVLLPVGGNGMTAVFPEERLSGCRNQLTGRLARETGAERVRVETGFALLTVVGGGLNGQSSLTDRLLMTLERSGVSVRMADPCGDRLLLVIPAAQYTAAVRMVYGLSCQREKTV